MARGIFEGCQITLELGTNLGFKEKQKLRKAVTENGGVVSFVLNKKVCAAFKRQATNRKVVPDFGLLTPCSKWLFHW